jgi:DNA repair exonuclease SbcCD ATPase subunit
VIPLRIMLKGFLCYRDEQEVLLDGSSLWMMAGLNGSGKSAIFDGMTFALFGHHRGGGQQIVELINHDSDRLNVEYDFALDGQTFRIRRTATRQARGDSARVTQQVLRRATANGTGERWEPVENTSSKTAFNEWVHDHIGLNYETFTSSVLLLQGRAEKLLEAGGKDRFEVLAGVVDLERYRRLFEKADTRRKELKSKVEVLRNQLDAHPAVSDEELAAVDERIRAAESRIAQGEAEVKRLLDVEGQARRWAELLAKKEAVEQRWRLAEVTLADAVAIQRDLDRLRELDDVLPLLTSACERKAGIHTAGAKIDILAREEKSLAERLAGHDHRLEQSRQKLSLLQKRRDDDENRHRDVQQQLRELSKLLSRVQMCEQQRETLRRLQTDLDALPGDIELRLGRLKEEGERLGELDRALPLLGRLHQQRERLRQVRDQEARLSGEEKTRLSRGDQLRKREQALQQELEVVARDRQQGDGKAVEERTLLDRARAGLRDFQGLKGAQVCRHCGQALTPGHYAEEKKRREQEVEEAKASSQQADIVQQKAQAEETRVRKALEACSKELAEARDEYRGWKRDLEQAQKDVQRLTQETAQAVADLPAFHRERAGGAGIDGEPAYPTEADLNALRQQVSGLGAARKQLAETETLHVRWRELRVQVEQTRQVLGTLEADLPGDVGALRRKHNSLEAQESALAGSLKATRDEERAGGDEVQRLSRERTDLHQKRTDVAGQLKTEETQRRLAQDEIERLRQKLPGVWQKTLDGAGTAEVHRLATERDKLKQADTEGKAERLHQARYTLESLRQSRQEIEAECERFPAEGRIPLAEVQQRLQTARGSLTACETGLREEQRRRAVLDSQRAQRDSVQKQLQEQEGEWNRYKLLAELLGRERLQRHLVRQAERQVVDHANAVLDRLSGGQLYLRLRGGEGEEMADKALELEAYNRSTAQAPINVAFLSGSQRFRVAVSLALGLGQYASRLHRPIESVIIDEGFGCLDRHGRQVMIQELQNLRGQLRCILLVSHQEEFADAFSDGYLFTLDNGATQVKRFQR